MGRNARQLPRREFVSTVVAAGLTGLAARPAFGRLAASPVLEAGEGVVDITPPLGIELAGFHRTVGKERRIEAIRQPSAARALVLRVKDTQAAIVSLDMLYLARDMARRVQTQVERQWGIPAANVHVCATHSHSMPTFRYMRQWGAVPSAYEAEVEKKVVAAVGQAKQDLASAELWVGKSKAVGASHNRTVKTPCKTDEQFTKDSTDEERWLDTLLQVLRFRRSGGKRDLLWYHFSAHAVCYADEQAGPDWPGVVAQNLREEEKLEASFLQGHIGDVNPGDGSDWRGEIRQTVAAVTPALKQALANVKKVSADTLRLGTVDCRLPLDLALHQAWRSEYQKDPAKCKNRSWVDPGFAADWFQGSDKWDPKQTHLSVPLSAMQLGEVGFIFHPAELYSCYGLIMRRDSPLPTTLVVGYADDSIGYVADPKAYVDGEYSATVVPKILDLPPFVPTAGREMTAAATALLKKVVG
jgi:hypothetical protein